MVPGSANTKHFLIETVSQQPHNIRNTCSVSKRVYSPTLCPTHHSVKKILFSYIFSTGSGNQPASAFHLFRKKSLRENFEEHVSNAQVRKKKENLETTDRRHLTSGHLNPDSTINIFGGRFLRLTEASATLKVTVKDGYSSASLRT